MNRDELLETWRAEERVPMIGWEWSRLKGRKKSDSLPWSYEECVRAAMADSNNMLDLGTGGGERLAALAVDLPPRTVATEGWPPNVSVASKRLEPLGIPVVATANKILPFESESFSLVINRHASYRPSEIARVLEAGGTYWTQQLDSSSHARIRFAFGRSSDPEIGNLGHRIEALRNAGLVIENARSHTLQIEYADVAALVSLLAGMPWVVPHFSVDRDRDHLLALHTASLDGQALTFPRTFLLIKAKRST